MRRRSGDERVRPLSDNLYWSTNKSSIEAMRIEDLVLLAQAEAPSRWVSVDEATRVAVQSRISKESAALVGGAMRSKNVRRLLSFIPRERFNQDMFDVENAIQVAVFYALEKPTMGPGRSIGQGFSGAILCCVYNAVYGHMRDQHGLRIIVRSWKEVDPSTGEEIVKTKKVFVTDTYLGEMDGAMLAKPSMDATAEDTQFAVDLVGARSKAMNPKYREAAEHLLGNGSFDKVQEVLGIDPRTAMSRFKKSNYGLMLEDELARMEGSGQGSGAVGRGRNAGRPHGGVGEGGAGSPPAEVAE